MVSYIKSDLEFILDQIKIAEAHAAYVQDPNDPAGKPLFGPGGSIPAYNIAWGLRTVDGTYNNLLNPELGSADNEFPEGLGTEFRTFMVPGGPGGQLVPVTYTPGVDNDGPGSAGPGDVFDPYVRTISNLIVDQSLGNPSAILTALQRAGVVAPENALDVTAQISAAYEPLVDEFRAVSEATRANAEAQASAKANPSNVSLQQQAAATAAALVAAEAALDAVDDDLMALLELNGVELDGQNVVITNAAPDEGLSAPFNSWFTLFGQFFDHGLDLVGKGGAGTVFVPLMPDDPLYVEGGSTNFMVMTRASLDGPNGRPINTTTPFVDQNQTYTSNPAHQVFLREYVLTGGANPVPVATGKLIEGSNGGMATWADVKAQAADLLGIQLLDSNVGNVPLLATDPYGNFIPGANGFPQIVTTTGLVEGNPAANGGAGVLVPANAIFTGHAFLADIAHNAVPNGLADGDLEIGLGNNDAAGTPGYDNELLDAHFIAGDGRANENIGLTAVHHVFHSEHNRLVEHTKEQILATGDNAFIQQWLVDGATIGDGVQDLEWNGERLFQAAKFGTEMQYQHLVFEEFARKIQPNINVFLVPDGYDVTLDPTIVAEFAHVVYRFGHSMLTESIDRYDPAFASDHIGLIEGFLNPLQFQNNGTNATVDADIAAGAVIRGMTRQAGNEIDEFVTSALRNNLLGLPLDLATINLARGRDTGVPSLNETRRQFYEATNQDALLKPYESWADFAAHLKHEASIINFIAAYGTHSSITSAGTIEAKRDAAFNLVLGGPDAPADRLDFLNATGAYAGGSLSGLEDVDLWIGGLAERIMPFGGMLGSTFNFVFEIQMENLQSADRFYYLQRLDGLHLFGEMENNSFAAMIMRNTDATHLPSDVFSTPGLILEVNQAQQFNDTNGDGVLDSLDPVGSGLLTPLVVRDNPATAGVDTNYIKYNGGDHVVLGGTDQADHLIAGIGDDTIHGDAGADRLEGGFGNDIINGGDGDDILTDMGGDDNIKAGAGHDVVHAGPGLDLVMGGPGQDFVFLGTDMGSEVFAGTGNDFIYGNKNAERILGNEGNDWIETGTFDGAPGDNFDEVFAHDGIDGHDVFLGDGGFDEFIGEGGDDIMVGSAGRGKMAGMSGFDWATYKDNARSVNADLSIPIIFDEAPTLPENAALDEYASMEGLSGSAHNDVLKGTNNVAADLAPIDPETNLGGTTGYRGSVLDAEGIALINGLQDVVGAGVNSFDGGDIILGGDGSDVITGQMGDDIIDGDKWLDVQIGVFASTNPDEHTGAPISLHNSMTQLASSMFSGAINPGQLSIVRTVRTADGSNDVDVAVFSDLRANYTITSNPNGTVTVAHTTVSDGLESDGTDTLRNIERLRFSDGEFDVPTPPTDIVWNGVIPGNGTALSGNLANGLPASPLGADTVIATLASVDADTTTGFVYALATGSSAGFTVSAGGVVTATNAMAPNTNYTLNITSTDTTGATRTETFDVRTGTNSVLFGTNGNNTIAGNANDSVIYGSGGNDALSGAAGDDSLYGQSGDDTLTGGTGNDLLAGGSGNDIAVFSGPVANYTFALVGANLRVTATSGTDGTDLLNEIEDVRFGATDLNLIQGTNGNNGGVNGTTGADLVLAHDGNDNIDAGLGNDVVRAGAGNDTINWDANATGATDGRDIVDGGDGIDTYDVDGNNNAETYRIYTRAEALLAGLNSIAAATEIVITRNGTTNASIIAELDNIEEIRLDAAGGTDTIQVIGDFTGTSLQLQTITIRGSVEDDIIDISSLQSEHRIVFKSLGGNDVIVGVLRPEDVIELPAGSDPAEYISTTVNGVTTLSNGVHSVSFNSAGQPEIVAQPSLVDIEEGDTLFYVSDEMTSDTQVTGTAGIDSLGLQGNYDLTFHANAMVDIEYLSLQSGSLATWGQNGNSLYNYNLATVDENVAGGQQLRINAQSLRAGENFTFNGSAETNGSFFIFAGHGVDHLTGGSGRDMFFFEAGRFGPEDKVDGGAGLDSVAIAGIEPGGANPIFINIAAGTLTSVEALSFNAKFATGPNVVPSYDVVLQSGNIAAGEKLIVNASSLSSSQFLLFDGSSETAGSLEMYGGGGADTLRSGSQADMIFAAGGADTLFGGGGADRFQYRSVNDSAAGAADRILDFMIGEDKIDLSFIDADANTEGDQGFSFIGSAAFSQSAGELKAQYDAASQEWTIEGDVDGNGAADFMIVAVTAQPEFLGAGDFIL